MNGQNLTKFCKQIIIDKIYVGIVKHHFSKFATELRPLIDVRNWFLLNILRMNAQNFTKFCIHIKASDKWLSKYEFEILHINLCYIVTRTGRWVTALVLTLYTLVVDMFMYTGYY